MRRFAGYLRAAAYAVCGPKRRVCGIRFGRSPKALYNFSKLELYVRYSSSKAALTQYAGDDLFLGFGVTEEQELAYNHGRRELYNGAVIKNQSGFGGFGE